MSKAKKLLDKIRNNPKSVPFDDLDRVLLGCGFTRRQAGGGSSHYYYTLGALTLSVPFKRPYVKEVYVRHALDLIDQAVDDEGEA